MTNGPWGLLLPGWENLSIWGWDAGLDTLFAQLTRNGGNDDDGPEIWITPPRFPVVTTSTALAEIIAKATSAPLAEVRAALNHAVDHQGAPAGLRLLP